MKAEGGRHMNGVEVLVAAFLTFNQVGEGSSPSDPICQTTAFALHLPSSASGSPRGLERWFPTALRSADSMSAVLGCWFESDHPDFDTGSHTARSFNG